MENGDPGSTGLVIEVCPFPPGTSKWNKREHNMFSYITQNWRGRALIRHEVVIHLIVNTSTGRGLKIKEELESGHYERGKKVRDEALQKVKIKYALFHGD
jgi:hypothetical protein